jgi:DNA-directed RNA polymerase subunit M/transcription elongation factor TFIIS
MADIANLLMGICDKCHSSEHTLTDNAVSTRSKDYSVTVYVISGHCERCAHAWNITVRVINVEYRTM